MNAIILAVVYIMSFMISIQKQMTNFDNIDLFQSL